MRKKLSKRLGFAMHRRTGHNLRSSEEFYKDLFKELERTFGVTDEATKEAAWILRGISRLRSKLDGKLFNEHGQAPTKLLTHIYYNGSEAYGWTENNDEITLTENAPEEIRAALNDCTNH